MIQAEQQQHQQQQTSCTLLYNAAGHPVAISLLPSTVGYELYKGTQTKIVGVLLIIIGLSIILIILNGIGIGLREVGTFLRHGRWCGIMVSKLCYFLCIFHVILSIIGLQSK